MITNIIISTLTGVISSFFVWWLTFKVFVPQIKFADNISRLETNENLSGFRYRLKFENSGFRNIIDLQVLVRLRIKGIRLAQPSNWEVVYLPTSSLQYTNVAIVRPSSTKRLRPVLEIKIYECDYFQNLIFPEEIRNLSKQKKLSLENVLDIGTQAEFQIIVLGYDQFSGARKFFESKFFTKSDILNGYFEINGLAIN